MAARFSLSEIEKAVRGAAVAASGVKDIMVSGVSTDTRTMTDGEAFFALIGENHDAHDHLAEAAQRGASVLVVQDSARVPKDYTGGIIVVEDTLRAYQDLAAYYRHQLNPTVIAVTGSVGKTTLKDMIACILAKDHRVVSTVGNLNNQIGTPRTILSADEDTEILVLEMGMAGAGEIRRLAEIARPNIAAITNIGISHRENFDDDEGILRAKYEIADYLGEQDALVIDAADNEALVQIAEKGSKEKGFALLLVARARSIAAEKAEWLVSDVHLSDRDEAQFEIVDVIKKERVAFSVPLPGLYAGTSAALACAVCKRLGVSLKDSAAALKTLTRTAHRLAVIRKNDVLIIDDTYNASPDSVRSGLELLKNVPAERKIAVLADMNQLGAASDALHKGVGAAASQSGIDRLYTYGEKARHIGEGAAGLVKTVSFGADEKDALIERLKADVRCGDAVYVKGSRSMKMEEIVNVLSEEHN